MTSRVLHISSHFSNPYPVTLVLTCVSFVDDNLHLCVARYRCVFSCVTTRTGFTALLLRSASWVLHRGLFVLTVFLHRISLRIRQFSTV